MYNKSANSKIKGNKHKSVHIKKYKHNMMKYKDILLDKCFVFNDNPIIMIINILH